MIPLVRMMKDFIPTIEKLRECLQPTTSALLKGKLCLIFLFVVSYGYGQQFVGYACLSQPTIDNAFIADPGGNLVYEPGVSYNFNLVVFDRLFPPRLTATFSHQYEWYFNGKFVQRTELLSTSLTLPPLDNGNYVLEVIPVQPCVSSFGVFYRKNKDQKVFEKQLTLTNPCEPGVTLTYAGAATDICSGTTQLYRLNNAADSYTWSASNGATVNVNGFEANVTFPLEGNYTVTATKNNNAACEYSIGAEVKTNPKPIDLIEGLFSTCQGNTQEFIVSGAENADVFNWTFPAGVTHTFPDASQRAVLVTFPATGSFNFGVAAQNSCGTRAATSFDVSVETVAVKDTGEVFTHTQLISLPTTQLILNTCEERASACLGKLQALNLKAQLDLGDVYDWGEQEFTTQVDFSMTGRDALGTTLFTENGTLTINKDSPGALYSKRVTTNFADLRSIDVAVTNYPGSGGVVDNTVRFKVWYEDQVEISVDKIKLNNHTAIPVSAGSWNVLFSWNSTCSLVDNYQLRLLRLFEGETVPDELDVRWSNATVIETASSGMFANIVLAEGTGQYLWQVRPVGNKPGGVANPVNLPLWPSEIHTLNFTQPDEEKNFIYSRTFTEGNRTSQQLTFANGLNQVQQQQTKLEEANQVVITQSLQDYSGRGVLQSLPVPVKDKTELGYQSQLMSNGTGLFTTADFDADNKIKDPTPAFLDKSVGDNGYYGGMDNGINEKVPDASGAPYTRTLFVNDGTGRPKEQAGVGGTHNLKGGKTVRYFYTGVAQQELDFMFGSEAPAAANTHKEITIDANNTASVTYKAKDGAAIATALVIGTGNDNLEGLDSRQAATRTITETVDVESAIAKGVSSATKKLVFTIPTGLQVDYSLSPATIEELCSSTCKTCDYEVTFILHDEEDPSNTVTLAAHTINAGAVDCASNTAHLRSFSLNLQAGSYILEKRVRSGNRAATGNRYIEDHLATVRSFHDNELATTFDPLNAYLTGANVDLQGLYNYLNVQGYVLVTPGTGDPYYEVSVGCDGDMIRIPFLEEDCEEQLTCDEIKNLDFVQYFVNYWNDEFGRSPREPGALNPARPINTRRSFRRYETYRFLRLEYSTVRRTRLMLPSEFNRMMHNLLTETDQLGTPLYDCQLVWDIWRQQVQNYEYLSNMQLGPNETPEGGNPVNYEYNFINNFLRAIENKLRETETDPERQLIRKEGFFEGRPTPLIMERIYELFYYNPEDEAMSNCMEGYINFYNSDPANTPCSQANLTESFNCLSYTERHNIYQCINFGDYTVDDPQNELQENLDLLTSQCLRACEDRREAFEQAVVDDIHNQGLYIEGDAFLLEFDSVRQVKVLTGGLRDPAVFDIDACEVEAMTDALVANCKGYCYIDFIRHPTSGEIIGVDTLVQRANLQKVLTADFEVIVNTGGETSCASVGWDYLNFQSIENPGVQSVVQNSISTQFNKVSYAISTEARAYLDSVDQDVFVQPYNSQLQIEQLDQGVAQLQLSNASSQSLVSNAVPDNIEYQALRDFFESTNGQNWTQITGWDYPNWKDPSSATSADFSDWFGINVVNGDVQSIDLNGNNVTGTLPVSIGNLSALESIDCGVNYSTGSFNNIGGSIPVEIGNLNSLSHLNFEGNSLIGILPTQLGNLTNLKHLDLSGNDLTGNIPIEFSNLLSLENLHLGANNFSGAIPSFLGGLNLRSLELLVNGFSGSIPIEIANITSLIELNLRSNGLTGSIPNELGNLSSLRVLNLSSNNFSGSIPVSLGNLTELTELDLGSCNLSGAIPGELGNLVKLTRLQLSFNNLNSSIPSTLGQLNSVTGVFLRRNMLTGSIPIELGSMTALRKLDLTSNQLTGAIIPELGDLTFLNQLLLSDNQFTGVIPPQIGTLSFLNRLDLSTNNLSGTLPSELSNLTNLSILDLSENNLSGSVPNTIGSLSKLNFLSLSNNSFSGNIPDELGNLSSLRFLYLHNNDLSGNLPETLGSLSNLKNFVASNNNFTGSVPTGLMNLSSLTEISLDNNNLTGIMPLRVNLTTTLHIWNNQFVFGDLEGLVGQSRAYMSYQPQFSTLGHPQVVTYLLGQTAMLPFTASGNFNIYQWEKYDGTNWASFGGQTATSNLTINNAQEADQGTYRCKVTNSVVTGLTLYSHEMQLTPIINNTCFINSLCFRFGDPIQDIPIPPGFEPYVFEAKPLTCAELNANSVIASLDYQKQRFLDTKLAGFRNNYETNCLDATKVNDQFTLSYDLGYHHYTLYYYDRAGNLMRTVPPKGFNTVDPDAHTLTTDYQYNSLGQLVDQNSPDGGETRFYYNDIGQLRFSQNARQQAEGTYSYTKYDRLGRIVEVGQSAEGVNVFMRRMNFMDFPATGEEKTVTIYSQPYQGTLSHPQRYLRNRVSYSYLDEDGLNTTTNDRTYTIYSYDPHGNVEWLEQVIPGLEQKHIAYSYDLLSGNVLQVKYNPGQPDQFYHKYEYDADNRITAVFTSIDGQLWDKDAAYEYYPHGPLKKAMVGQDRVQQLDYMYTIHGWLKAINDPASNDPLDVITGKDAFAMALNYYSGDYQRSGSTLGTLAPATGRDLYNGNISAWEMATHASDDSWMHTGYQYTYDELNRIQNSRFNVGREGTFYSRGGFQANFTLDANGNLVTLDRNDIDANRFDALTYHLQNGNNRLDHVSDAITDAEVHAKDIESQSVVNYVYDPIGNLIRDNQEKMDIEWTVYGKVDELIKTNGGTKFTYDPAGNRVRKQTTDEYGNVYSTYYIRDASGNIMATYRRQDIAGAAGIAELKEVPLYGSDRLGVYTPEGAFENNQQSSADVSTNTSVSTYQGVSYTVDQGVSLTLEPGFSYEDGIDGDLFMITGPGSADGPQPANVYVRNLDRKQYELKDHLGNVRAVVSDRKLSSVNGAVPSDFRPSIISASSYYPYGMDLPTVHWEPDTSIATMEPADAPLELPGFHNYAAVPVSYDPIFNHTETYVNEGVGGPPSASVKLTAANETNIIGLAKSLKVQAGDKINMKVYGKYTTPLDPNDLTNVAASLGGAFVDAFGFQGTQEGMALGQFFSDLFAQGITFAGTNDNTEQVNAYLNYLLFDNDYILQDAGFASLGNEARENGTNIIHDSLKFELIPQQDGYLYIYTSNESPQVTDVYFDDFTVIHEKLVPDVAYDPDLLGYRYGFNGKEKDQRDEWGTRESTEAVEWTNLVNAAVEGNGLVKTNAASGWNTSGASSVQRLEAGEDGWVRFSVPQRDGEVAVGLSQADYDQSIEEMDYGMVLDDDGKWWVYESGVSQIPFPARPAYEIGDVFTIERLGDRIYYRQNGKTEYSTRVSTSQSLVVDVSINDLGRRVEDVVLSFGGASQVGAGGALAHYDYGFRIYNPAVGRFLSVDPLTQTYPMLTPYQFASNTPIQAIDLDGLEAKIIVNSQYNIKRIAKLFHPNKNDVNSKVNEQMALAIAYYSTEARYPNDAHTRMYPDVNFPESGLAAEGSVDNSFEGVQIWGTIGTDENGNDINVLLGTVNREEGFFEEAFNVVRGGKVRDATDFEKILIENFDQEALSELAEIFASGDKQEVFKFLKEKNVIEENTVRGGRGQGAIQDLESTGEGDTTYYYGKHYTDNETNERVHVVGDDTARVKREDQ